MTTGDAQTPARDESAPRVPTTSPAPATLPAAPLPTPTTPSLNPLPPANTQALPDGKGGVIYVPADATMKEFLDWLDQRNLRNPLNAVGPTASVTAVELDGETDDQMAALNCHLTVQIAGNQFPMPFAVGLGEAVIRRREVKGPGQVHFGGRDRDRGYIWWFEKPGEYEFTLQITVPLLKASPWRRLQLSVPNSPVTSLRLSVPSASVLVKAPEDVIQTTRPVDEQRSEIRAAGFGGKVEILSWQATVPVTEGPAGLDVSSNIAVRSTNDAFLLDAVQYVRALQGTFREFTVRLPSRGELLQVDGTEISETRVNETDTEKVTLVLKAATNGPISVRWQVRVPHLSRRNFDLDGFQVEGARRESGEVGFLAVEGFRWNVADGSDPHIERMNAGEFRSGEFRGTAVRAFRFFSQPFRLPTTLAPVEPYYDVATLFALTAAEKEIGLEARFRVRVYRGQLPELSLVWPGWRSEGWILEGTQPKGAIVTNVTTDDEGGQGRIVVTLAERPTDEAFEWKLLARRPRTANEDASITLPRVLAPTGSPTRLVLLSDENIDAQLTPRDETVLRPFVPASSTADNATFATEQRPQNYRIDTDERSFQLGITTQSQQISVTSEISGVFSSRRLELRQRLEHHVSYARLNELKVSVPAAIAERVKFFFADSPQVPQWSDGAGGREKIATIALPKPMIGTIPLEAVWSIPIPKGLLQDQFDEPLPLQVLRGLSGPTTNHRLRIAQPAWLDVSLVEPAWKSEHADESEMVWGNTQPVESITLRVKPATLMRGEDLVARKAMARVHIDQAGVHHNRFEIVLSGPLRQVHVQLPKSAIAGEFLWNDVPLPVDAVTEIPEGSGRYSLSFPEAADTVTGDRLTIEYRLPTGKTLGWSTASTLSVPVLPQCRWMADIAWEVSFPSDQHLFRYPDSATPWFHWERTGMVWRRVSPVLLSNTTERTGPGDPVISASHAYAFGQFGALSPFPVRSISMSAALLWGVLTTFTLGMLVVKLPRFPRVLVGVAGVLGLLIAGLWFQPQIELLMQPMLLGAVYPILNAMFGWWKHRTFSPTVLTLDPTPSELRTHSGSHPTAPGLRALNPDSATVYRPPVTADPPSIRVAAESHLG